jgi:hypothetical protein
MQLKHMSEVMLNKDTLVTHIKEVFQTISTRP